MNNPLVTPAIIIIVALVAAIAVDLVLLSKENQGCATLLVVLALGAFLVVAGLEEVNDKVIHRECDAVQGEFATNGWARASCTVDGIILYNFDVKPIDGTFEPRERGRW